LVARYGEVAERYLANDYCRRLVYRGVYPSWDNTARVDGAGLVTLDSTPENYERWLNRATQRTLLERQHSQRLLFINAWNEWAEGCHLEPDRNYGSAFLEATLRVKERRSKLDTAFPIEQVGPALAAEGGHGNGNGAVAVPVTLADPVPVAVADPVPVALADPGPVALADPGPVALAISEPVVANPAGPPGVPHIRRPIVHRIARSLRGHPKLFHAAQIAWRDMLALRAWARRTTSTSRRS
jgi:hypothetical protein